MTFDWPIQQRTAAVDLSPGAFRSLGYQLVDQLADFLATLPTRPVTPDERPLAVRAALGGDRLPEQGTDPAKLLQETVSLLFEHSAFNSHPRFLGYVPSAAAPIGALGELLAAIVNPNVGGWRGGQMATEIEAQTVRWIAELLNYPSDCGGLMVSGGTVGNFIGFVAARNAMAGRDIRDDGLSGDRPRLRLYASNQSHRWVQKAVNLFGLGNRSIHWVPTDDQLRMDVAALEEAIRADKADGDRPFLVIGTAGTVGFGAIDPLPRIASLCRQLGLWFHVDAAYGGFAALLPDAPPDLVGLREADSVAVDPHKWLYASYEAGCALVRNASSLRNAFSHRLVTEAPGETSDQAIDYHEFGMQNSRGFRALKVWLGLRQAGREGYARMIGEDVALAKALYVLTTSHPELQAFTQSLSITTFRFVPNDLIPGLPRVNAYLNLLNAELLQRLQCSGELYLSKAVLDGTFLLRACVTNFRTTEDDIRAIPEIVSRLGRMTDGQLRDQSF